MIGFAVFAVGLANTWIAFALCVKPPGPHWPMACVAIAGLDARRDPDRGSHRRT